LYSFYGLQAYRYGRDDDNIIIDAERRELELTIIELGERIADLETKLTGALSNIDYNYREMKGLERDIDEIYRRVF
jgi:hypothetical protein